MNYKLDNIKSIIIILVIIIINSISIVKSQALDISEVTCGSAIKLTHGSSNYKLHSEKKVVYGTGSGQQGVTGLPLPDDPESLWIVKAANGDICHRGKAILCDSIIRLQHAGTNKFLHSHQHRSPLSNQQEISAFDGLDSGDNWKIICTNKSSTHWNREEKIYLQHVETGRYLSANRDHTYSNPIHGHIEVVGSSRNDKNSEWISQEGIYFAVID
ncbi:22697_t:CDS:2 [Entrophospora sp. SA101]|nr:13912_t:CDS:2 [Entrophospora sp. SA101]CAJ0634893.1 1194_t:CDS:2 [Entrophospora sp. SA101]CAJ0634903.1 1201_t:CDS:2 [Entrophospora sp. SA101]CAJ0753781.1 8740_t:CDS:2 [Entrophospora sp. SA101]CAJ0761555.1 22697_t:CDS:2 [Entrophospora sp. SA101]